MRVCSYCHLLLADAETVCSHDGVQTKPAEIPPIPSQLHDKFTSLEPYARGQTGTCHVATQQQSGYRGLLKVIPLSGIEASERVRLKRELRKQTRLSHDGLPRIIDGGEVGAQLWLFREYIQGESLAQRIRRLGKLEPGEALAITAQVASALDELQRNGLLHRDVKPGHIVLQQSAGGPRMAKLIDAGVAARLPSGSVFGLLGTPAYISPEQVAGKLVSFRSDLYALGCVLFEMLSGQPPFPDEDVQAVLEAHKSIAAPELQLELPTQVRTLLHGLLAKEPRQRPFSAQQVRRTLEPLLPPGTPLPAVGTRAPASSLAPRAGGAAGRLSHATEVLNDVELEELAVSSSELIGPGPKTLHLSDDEVDELAVSSPELVGPGPKTLHLSDDEVDELEVGADSLSQSGEGSSAPVRAPRPEGARGEAVGGPTVANRGEQAQRRPSERPLPLQEAVSRDPDASGGDSSPRVAVSIRDAQAGAEPAQAAKVPAAGRRSVDFDVESLFEDDLKSEPASLQDAVPTQLFRPRGDDSPAPATQFAAKAPAVPAVPQPSQSDPGAPAVGDPEGTLAKARRPGRPRRIVPWALAVAAIALVAYGLLSRSRQRHDAVSAPAAGSTTATAQAPAPPEPAAAVAPEPSAGKQEAPTLAVAAEPNPAQQPAAAQAPSKEAPPAQAAPGAQTPGTATGKEPAASDGHSGVLPATIAAGTRTTPASAGQATPGAQATGASSPGTHSTPTSTTSPGTRSAELNAANAAGRSQSGSGDARLPPAATGARPERVSKSDELKSQGRDLYQAGRFRDAAAAYQKATEQNPSDAGAFAGLAASRLAAGDAAAAVQAYSRAVRLQPDSSGFHAALGRAYLQKGDRDRARSAYKHALELNPNNGAAKAALAQLK